MMGCSQGVGIQSVSLDGLRCIGGGFTRHGGRSADPDGAIGITNAWGGPTYGPPIGIIAPGGYVSGQTKLFQVTHRDVDSHEQTPGIACVKELGTTNAVRVIMVP